MFDFLFTLVFILIGGMIVYAIVAGISEWNSNNNSPRLTVSALIVSKRVWVNPQHMRTGVYAHHSHHSFYVCYVTFEVESGDRMELSVPVGEYGLLAEGDRGQLSFQGTRYLGFEREK